MRGGDIGSPPSSSWTPHGRARAYDSNRNGISFNNNYISNRKKKNQTRLNEQRARAHILKTVAILLSFVAMV